MVKIRKPNSILGFLDLNWICFNWTYCYCHQAKVNGNWLFMLQEDKFESSILQYSVICTSSNTACSSGVILPLIRILFHVNERQLNHVYHHFTYFSPSPYSGGEASVAPLNVSLGHVSCIKPAHGQLQHCNTGASMSLSATGSEATPHRATLLGYGDSGGNWGLQYATDCYCLQNEV